MKLIIAAAVFVLSHAASAQTNVIFSGDGSKATIMMLALNSNPDADALFLAMAQAPQNTNGKLSKSLDFKTTDGEQVFDIQCVFSKIVAGEGSCITVIEASKYLQMDPSSNRLKFQLTGANAAALANLFLLPNSEGAPIFISSDKKMVIDATRDASGAATTLTVTYGY